MIFEKDILEESTQCFLDYSKEVLSERAIPAIEDGLLRGQREILWTMTQLLKMRPEGNTKKCASIVGTTMAAAFIHGDSSCYGSLCKMSLPFLMRYPLIIGQGSLGTQEDNSLRSAARYTEAKPSSFAELLFNDYAKNVVPTFLTYNEEYEEPSILPSLFPNAICNGREGIGVSMSHNSLPHNLTEVCNAAIEYIKDPSSFTIDKLISIMPSPDFPCGGAIVNGQDVRRAFETGKSSVSLKIQGNYTYDAKTHTLTFTSIPYRTYRNFIKEQISKNIEVFEPLIDDFNDCSNLGRTELVFKLKKGVGTEKLLTALFNLTDLQSSVSYNMNFLVNGTPKMCSMIDLISNYVQHQENVLIRSTQFDYDKAQGRIHILKGLLLALKDIDSVIALIRNSNSKKDAAAALQSYLSIDEIQANAILDMKLSRLTKLDETDLLNELKTKEEFVEECRRILEIKTYRDSVLIKKIAAMRDKYGDARRTVVMYCKEIKTLKDEGIEGEYWISAKQGRLDLSPKKKVGAFKCGESQLFLAASTNGRMYRIRPSDIPTSIGSIAFACPLGEIKNFTVVTKEYIKLLSTKEFQGEKASKVGLKMTPLTDIESVSLTPSTSVTIEGRTYNLSIGTKASKGTKR